MRSRVIGGEFELCSIPEGRFHQRIHNNYACGRAALYKILQSINPAPVKVWLPDWLCESMIDAARKAGVNYDFYRLGPDYRLDVQQFLDNHNPVGGQEVILLVNYFGLTDVETTISELKSQEVDAVIIEDDVQALFSFLDNGEHSADYRFTSLRKTIASPDGGLVKTRKRISPPQKENSFAPLKLKGALTKGKADERTDDLEYLSLFEQGEALIDDNYESGMSGEGWKIYTSTDFDFVAKRRRANAQFLIKELSVCGIEPLMPIMPDDVPLFVPIKIGRRDEVRKALRQHNIFCPVHWPLRDDMMILQMGLEMAEKELSLVIDQRYTEEDMMCIVEVIKDALWKLS